MSFQAMHDMQRCCSGNKADLCQINSPVCPLRHRSGIRSMDPLLLLTWLIYTCDPVDSPLCDAERQSRMASLRKTHRV